MITVLFPRRSVLLSGRSGFGQGALAQTQFRISTMGDITDYDMERLLAGFDPVFAAGG